MLHGKRTGECVDHLVNKPSEDFGNHLRQILAHTDMIPPLPETARRLLDLRSQEDPHIDNLVSLIEADPCLSAFILRYARMSIFGFGERITSVTHAVSLALGFPSTLNISIGVASAGCLKIPDHGPLGRIRIWSQALGCAALCRELWKAMDNNQKKLVNPDLAYLCGLFHNFGYLLFGHLLPKQFSLLNDLSTRHPETDIRQLELHAFGITHDVIGTYLIKAWNLPDEIATAVAEHHFPDYAGKHVHYVKLVAAANRLLEAENSADVCDHLETSTLLESLGIVADDAVAALEAIRTCQNDFDNLAKGLN